MGKKSKARKEEKKKFYEDLTLLVVPNGSL